MTAGGSEFLGDGNSGAWVEVIMPNSEYQRNPLPSILGEVEFMGENS